MSISAIGIVTAFFKPHMGGVESYAERLANQLVSQGINVIVITSSSDEANTLETSDGYTILRLPSRAIIDGRFPLLIPGQALKKAKQWLYNQPLDGLLINTRYYPLSIFGLKLARRKGIPAIVLDHSSGHLSSDKTLMGWAIRLYERLMTARVKAFDPMFFAVSEKSSLWLRSLGIEPQGKLPNAIDPNEFNSIASDINYRSCLELPSDAFIVAFAGRLIPEKGVMKVARAVSQLAANQPRIHLLIAGEGPLQDQLQASISSNVYFLGRLEKPELSALLAQSNVFCFPTDYPEGLPTVLLEAAVSNCAIIVSSTGGSDELVPSEEFGIVLKTTSIEQIKDSIEFLYSNDKLCQSMANKARDLVCENLSWESTANALIKALV